MGSVQDYIKCIICENAEMISDYYYKSDELYESCDVCGYYHTVKIVNKPDGEYLKANNHKYPDDWKPEYQEIKGQTGYVVKAFPENGTGYSVACVEEKDLENLINALEQDEQVKFFGITYKNPKGFYQTQIFKL